MRLDTSLFQHSDSDSDEASKPDQRRVHSGSSIRLRDQTRISVEASMTRVYCTCQENAYPRHSEGDTDYLIAGVSRVLQPPEIIERTSYNPAIHPLHLFRPSTSRFEHLNVDRTSIRVRRSHIVVQKPLSRFNHSSGSSTLDLRGRTSRANTKGRPTVDPKVRNRTGCEAGSAVGRSDAGFLRQSLSMDPAIFVRPAAPGTRPVFVPLHHLLVLSQ